jgi:hypothetical protein
LDVKRHFAGPGRDIPISKENVFKAARRLAALRLVTIVDDEGDQLTIQITKMGMLPAQYIAELLK